MEGLVYTSRQLNSLTASLALFNFAVLCETNQINTVETALRKCYDYITVMFAYNEIEPLPAGAPVCVCVCVCVHVLVFKPK